MTCSGNQHGFSWDSTQTKTFPPEGMVCDCGAKVIDYWFDGKTGYTMIVVVDDE